MQFLLANPAWLWLLSLAAVPLLVHLFARSNPPKFSFSSIVFLQRIMKKTARLRKPQDWLVLLLRTLAVLALLFVFLQPLLTGEKASLGGNKTTIFLIDRSASMAAKDGAESRFSDACTEAGELLAAGSADAANVIWIDAEPDALFPQPGPNLDYIEEALKRAEVRQESGGLSSAVQLAISQFEQVQGERELVILSDFQSAAWRDFPLNLPRDIQVVKVKVGAEDVANVAVHELFVSPAEPVVGQDVLVVCRLRNYSALPRRTTLYLESDGGRQSRDVEIPAWGEGEMNFTSRFTHAGLLPLRASIAEDVFPGDDRRHALVRVRETLKLVSVSPKEDSLHSQAPQVLRRLAASLDWLEFREVPAAVLPQPGAADYLFIHSWKGTGIEELQALAKAGTTLMVQPALGCSLEACQQLMGLETTGESGAIPVDTKGGRKTDELSANLAGWQAGISNQAGENSPVFALFKSGEFGNPAAGVFLRRLRLPQQWPQQVQRLIDYRDGVPGLLSTRGNEAGGAPIVLWNLPMADKLSSWSAQAPFVPFMGELLLHSRAASQESGTEALPGSTLTWAPGVEISPESVILEDGSGQLLETSIQMTPRGVQISSAAPVTPGLHQWKIGDGVAFQQVVNFPATESDLRLMDPAGIQGGEVVDTRSLLRRAELGDGIPLWPWFVAATFAFLVLESLVGQWRPKPANPSAPIR